MVGWCAEFKEEISSLLDGELAQHKHAILAEHLAACQSCKRSHDQAKWLGMILRRQTADVQAAAPDLWPAIAGSLPSVCASVQDDLSAYLDGELMATAKEGVSAHLGECSVCLGRFRQLSKLTGLLSKELALPATAEVDIWSGLKARLNEDCLLIKTELSAFSDREVNTLRHRTITAHLTQCADCTRDFNELAQTGDVLRTYYQPEDADSINIWPALAAQLKVVPMMDARQKKRAPQPVRRLYTVAAAVVAGTLATSTFLWFNNVGGTSVQPVTAETYLIDQSLGDPADVAEAVAYDHSDD